MKTIKLTLVALAIVASATSAFAAGPGNGRDFNGSTYQSGYSASDSSDRAAMPLVENDTHDSHN